MAFPVSPTEGQTFTENNTVWIYSAVTDQWNRSVINPLNQTTYIGSDGAPGGIGGATQVIFNDNGSLASDAGLVYNKTTDVLTTGSLRATSLGTAAAPGIAFASDPNTGIYSPGADRLAVATNGTGRLFVDASGNVGVGRNNPTQLLDIEGTSNPSIQITRTSYGGGVIERSFNDLTIESIAGSSTRRNIVFATNDSITRTERLRITSAGLVGIGTSSPGYALDVRGAQDDATNFLFNGLNVVNTTNQSAVSNKAGIRLGVTSDSGVRAAKIIAFEDGSNTFNVGLGFDVNATDAADSTTRALTITSLGRVGIGTTSPVAPLDVIAARGNLVRFQESSSPYNGLVFQTDSTGATIKSNANAGYLAFNTGNSERARITSAGLVGIGTSAPSSLLHVQGSDIGIFVKSTNSSGSSKLVFGNDLVNEAQIFYNGSTKGTFGGNGALTIYHGGNKPILFATANTERIRIDGSGRLLVGTGSDSGGALFQVNGDRIRVGTAKTPATSGATGTTGEIAWDADYIYVCTATNTWKRSAIATW
jgi:hypothetical protein